ncbi:hypothetical protein FLL45_01535 [Aliikangiella marina]|uniref:Phage gp6-like head-tail connector protein n=1 Tax=Aliikangiella marina TaxID=1712262 RepID=A0A545THG0_9GAMM|nr:head-tail connector protein [Aliikangiella marina]TQV76669.1 hypothetical protein FLL45_01535 [Aliikangiella marina]
MHLVKIKDPQSTKAIAARLETIKEQLKIDHDDEDLLIQRLIKTAAEKVSNIIQKPLINTEYDLVLDCFPTGELTLQVCPLVSIASISYYDVNGVLQTFDSANYELQGHGLDPCIYLVEGASWPSTKSGRNRVIIRLTAGHGDKPEDLPEEIQHAISLLVGHWYENREASNDVDIDDALNALLDVHQRIVL